MGNYSHYPVLPGQIMWTNSTVPREREIPGPDVDQSAIDRLFDKELARLHSPQHARASTLVDNREMFAVLKIVAKNHGWEMHGGSNGQTITVTLTRQHAKSF